MNNNSKQILLSVLGVAILVVAVVGVSFAAFTFSQEGEVENYIQTGTITMTYTEGSTGITLTEALPMADAQGKLLSGEGQKFDFSVQATLSSATTINYEITAIKQAITGEGITQLKDTDVKLYLEKSVGDTANYVQSMAPANFTPISTASETGSPVGSMVLESGSFTTTGSTIHNYRLRMWMDQNAQVTGTTQKFSVKVNVYAKQVVE